MFAKLILNLIFGDEIFEIFVPIRGRWGQYDLEDTIRGIIPAQLTIQRSSPQGYYISVPKGCSVEVDERTHILFLYDRNGRVILSVLPRGYWERHRLAVFWDDDLFKFKIKKNSERPYRIAQDPFRKKDPP
jgi:hypothetical protein